ncbi:uncharacterized protein TNCV_986841 [Trichonephila clavipes]|nr:uncharacterized protein TNCV_986841 [Trichonephila clavipes]
MIKSIRTLSLPVPTRSENFNLFFQSLERAFLTKKITDEYKSEILIDLLGERAHNVLLYIKKEELNDYEKLKSIVLREFQLTPRECLNSFKNAVKSSGETYIQFAARLTANFQYYCSLRKVNSFESLCDLIISDKLFETLNKETATHISIREAEDWFRPIDLAKECDIYISSRSGSQNQPVTALIDSGCQIPVLNSSLIRVNQPSEEIITLSSCFGEQRMVEVKPINISLDQHSSGLSVRTAISPTLTEEFIIHPSVYAEIKKLGHAKSDVLLNESESSLGAYAYPSVVSVSILCKKVNGAMKTSSVEFISRSPTPSPMKSKQRRFVLLRRIFEPWQWKRRKKRDRFEQTSRTLERKISMRSTKDQLVKKDVLMPVKHNSLSVPSFLYVSDSPLVSMKKEKRKTYRCGQRTVRLAGCGMQPKPSSLRAQAQLSETQTKTLRNSWTLEKEKNGEERRRCASRRYHKNIIKTYLLE